MEQHQYCRSSRVVGIELRMLLGSLLLGAPFALTTRWPATAHPVAYRSTKMMVSMSNDGEDATAAYAGIFAQSLGINKAWAWSKGSAEAVMLQRTARDIGGNTLRTFVQSYEVSDGKWEQTSPFPLELRTVVSFCPSPSGKLLAIVREAPSEGKAAKTDYVIEIWANEQSEGSLVEQIPTAGVHGKIVGGTWFGGLSWSLDESKLLYVAQKKDIETRSFFTKEPEKAGDSAPAPGDTFLYDEDWGEKYDGVSRLGLFIADLSGTGAIEEITGVDSDLTPGQPRFSKDGEHVVYVAWEDKPRKLGMIYCYQRPCTLYSVRVSDMLARLKKKAPGGSSGGDEIAVTPTDKSGSAAGEKGSGQEHVCLCPSWKLARDPRFSPSGDRLVWLSREEGFDTHNGCFRLSCAPWDAKTGRFADAPRTLVDIVAVPETPHAFPGLWVDSLPEKCWTLDGSSIFLSSAWGSRQSVVRVDSTTGKIERMVCATDIAGQNPSTGEPENASASVLAAGEMGVYVTASSPNSPGGVGIIVSSGDLEYAIPGPAIGGASIATYPYVGRQDVKKLKGAVSEIRWRVLPVPVPAPEEDGDAEKPGRQHPIEAILLMPPSGEGERSGDAGGESSSIPLLVTPHGGPHSVMTTAFVPAYAFLSVVLRVAILHVNFRGSTGFGTTALESLSGRIGKQDVADVVAATKLALATERRLDPSRIGVSGGSHGGFLGSHLTAQHPDIYTTAVLRNPVTNIPGMVSVSDIPDWCYIEALGHGRYKWDSFRPTTAEELRIMWEASPVRYVGGVRAPTLIALGLRDRRVPASQGLEWYHTLKSSGVEARLLRYPEDVHAIDKPASEADLWLNVVSWLRQYLL